MEIKNILDIKVDEVDNLSIFGKKVHLIISNYLSQFVTDENSSDEETELEVKAVKNVISILKKHSNLKFDYEDYFEVVFKIKNTNYSLTVNTPFNLVEKGSPAYFEYKIKTPEDKFLIDYIGSWQENGIVLSIRENVNDLIFDDAKMYEKNRVAYAKAISNIYKCKTEMEIREKLNDVFDVLSNVINHTSVDLEEFDEEYISNWAQTFFQICAFVVENKELVNFSITQLPIYINSHGRLVFHNVIENQSLSYEIDYSLDLEEGLNEEDRRNKVLNDTISFISEGNNLEKSLLEFNPLSEGVALPKGEIEKQENVNFGQLIFFLYCYLIWKRNENPEKQLNSAEIINPIFNILNKSEHFERSNIFKNSTNRYYRVKGKSLGIIISFDYDESSLLQTYSRLFALIDNQEGNTSCVSIKQRYSVPFSGLPFSIFLIDNVHNIELNKVYPLDNTFEKMNNIIKDYKPEISVYTTERNPQFEELKLLISDVFNLGFKEKLKNVNYDEIAYNLTKFHEIITEETSFNIKINQSIFLKDDENNFILGNLISKE